MLVQVNAWYNNFYNAIQDYDQPGFVALLWYFLFLASVYIRVPPNAGPRDVLWMAILAFSPTESSRQNTTCSWS